MKKSLKINNQVYTESTIDILLETFLQMNKESGKQLFTIIDLKTKWYLHQISPLISKASRVKSSNLDYCILLKKDTLKLRSKIRRFPAIMNELNLPFNVSFQFASEDLYKIAPIEEIII